MRSAARPALAALLLLATPAWAFPAGAPPPGAAAVADCRPTGPVYPFADCAVSFAYRAANDGFFAAYRAANDAFFAAYRAAMCLTLGC